MNKHHMKVLGACALLGGALLATAALASRHGYPDTEPQQQTHTTHSPSGLVFSCTPQQLQRIKPAVDSYLEREGIDLRLVQTHTDAQSRTLQYTLVAPLADAITLDLADRPALHIRDALVSLPAGKGGVRTVMTVSKAEILYAMMQSGRTTVFDGPACDPQALVDQVGIRQNTVAWAESLSWQWPEGGPAVWNRKYWRRGDLVKGRSLHEAVNDAFINQDRYAIGCYTATKLVVLQGILDYYPRVQPNPRMLALVQTRLLQDGEPLRHIEPGAMWYFEADHQPSDQARPGKLLALQHRVAAKNFIPGDWTYFLNTDPETYEKTGYEGSNALYLGRGKFDDYYNDHHHAYTYKEKMHEVYQWRNKIFSSHRDIAKVQPLSAADFERLAATPAQGGIQLDYRAVPLLLGYQPLPSMHL